MRSAIKYTLILAISSFLWSCVSQQKYDALLADKVKADSEINDFKSRLSKSEKEVEKLNQQMDQMVKDRDATLQRLDTTTAALRGLENKHDDLQTIYDNLLKNSGKMNRDLAEQQARLLGMERNLETIQQKNDKLASDLEAREQKVEELEQILEKQEQAVNGLKDKISQALLSFKEKDLTVDIRNGKVYVSLAEQLLFQSGSIQVDPKGINALEQLANALSDTKDIHIMIEGHTDNVPISRPSQYMKDNWDLSVMRATSISKILINGGVSPEQITASGRGEHSPVTDNESPEGRQKNRRTEIIITPNLDELFKILQAN